MGPVHARLTGNEPHRPILEPSTGRCKHLRELVALSATTATPMAAWAENHGTRRTMRTKRAGPSLQRRRTLFRFARELRSSFGDRDSGKHARCPNVGGMSQVNRLIQRTTLYADRFGSAAPLMPQPRATVRAESALQHVTSVGGACPKCGCASCHAKCPPRDDDRDTEGGGRLLSALLAMAYVQLERLAGKLIADRTTLTAPARNALAHSLSSAGARRFAPAGSSTGLDASLSKEINICPFDQLRRFDSKPSHKTPSFADTRLRELAFVENDFKFKKVPQVFDVVQVDPCSSDEK